MSLFTTIDSTVTPNIFKFSDFITALSLLVIVYTITDYRYKFRIASTHLPLKKLTAYSISLIGLQSLALEIWRSQKWYVLNISWFTQVEWQVCCALIFLFIVVLWINVAFYTPPIFSRKNYKQYASELYKCILRGNEGELKVIADELSLSANSLISNLNRTNNNRNDKFSGYAHDIFLLIAEPKFCKAIVNFSPGTIIALMDPILKDKKCKPPIGQFLLNITIEALRNKNSFLYVEKQGPDSGLMGYLSPVSNTMFSNYQVLSRLTDGTSSTGGLSLIDISYEEYEQWDSKQWDAYCNIVLIVLKNFIESGSAKTQEPSFVYRVFDTLEYPLGSLSNIAKVNDLEESVITRKLKVICDFVKKSVDLLNTTENTPTSLSRVTEFQFPKNIYDYLALFIVKIIYYSSGVDSTSFICWHVQHNIVWDSLMESTVYNTKAWKVVHLKVRRLLYDEISRLFSSPNYKSARILAYCLNIFGLNLQRRKTPYSRFIRLILIQTQNHFLSLRNQLPDVAKAVLIGAVTFQEENHRLVWTAFNKGLEKEARKQYLELKRTN